MQSPRRRIAAICTPRRVRLAALVGSALVVVVVTVARLAVSLVPSASSQQTVLGSVLHANAAKLPPLAPGKLLKIKHDYGLDAGTFTTTTTFALHGNTEQRGIHFRLRNVGGAQNPALVEQDATLVIVVLTDGNSYGPGRMVDALFSLLRSATLRSEIMSVTLLTSNMDEFHVIRARLYDYITDFMQLSLLFRNDFKPATRRAVDRYAMLARYRNFALHSTLLEWHQHVVWMDPDVYAMPPALLTKMVRSGGDIIAPLCIRASNTVNATNVRFDARAFRTELRQWRNFRSDDARVRHRLVDARASGIDWTPLDSVGAKLLYVRADVHRQGVAFPYFNALPDRNAGDDEAEGIEAGGLCHAAHFVGYRCWGMPLEPVYHHYTDLGNWS